MVALQYKKDADGSDHGLDGPSSPGGEGGDFRLVFWVQSGGTEREGGIFSCRLGSPFVEGCQNWARSSGASRVFGFEK